MIIKRYENSISTSPISAIVVTNDCSLIDPGILITKTDNSREGMSRICLAEFLNEAQEEMVPLELFPNPLKQEFLKIFRMF